MWFPVSVPYCHEIAVITPVKESFARVFLHLALPEGYHVEAIKVYFERLIACLVALLNFFDNVGFTGCGHKSGKHVDVSVDIVVDCSWFEDAWPTDKAWHTPASFPVSVLLTTERRDTTIWPTHLLSAVVS